MENNRNVIYYKPEKKYFLNRKVAKASLGCNKFLRCMKKGDILFLPYKDIAFNEIFSNTKQNK